MWKKIRRRALAHLLLAAGFLVIYLGYSLGYLAFILAIPAFVMARRHSATTPPLEELPPPGSL